MTVIYEWDREMVADGDSEDYEDEECVDHRHGISYMDVVLSAREEPPAGFKWRIVLVRDDDDRRAWAYLEDGKLPEHFTDAEGDDYKPVPKRFHKEVAST
jgi:hypothetical protein